MTQCIELWLQDIYTSITKKWIVNTAEALLQKIMQNIQKSL